MMTDPTDLSGTPKSEDKVNGRTMPMDTGYKEM